ncbi:MAG: RiPP maturation radical SAM C-methyltransferase [Bacteroidota bacterium]
MKRVLLINMPFGEVRYPSLAHGLFKAKFQEEGIDCEVRYLNIRFAEMVGLENYDKIIRLSGLMAGEQMFARALFGNHIPDDSAYYNDIVLKYVHADLIPHLQFMKSQIIPFLNKCLEEVPWGAYDIIGFTSLFEQNTPSLAMAYRVKHRFPDKTIVFGGANCEAIMGLNMHRNFPFIDFICSGESDYSFPELVKRLSYGHPVNDLPGIVYRDKGESHFTGKGSMIRKMDALPIPNFDDFFRQIQGSSLAPHIESCLLLESARGCWWGEKSHCTFCGLNGLGMTFRSKSADRCLEEIKQIVSKYSVRHIRMVDNIINMSYFKNVLPKIAAMKLGVHLIFEVKANLRKSQIKILSDANVEVQIGIENMSSHTLKLMGKGSKALMNVQTLKWCKQYQLITDWNILYGFPGETADDYRYNYELALILTHLDPPTGLGPIRMDRFSPNFDKAEKMGFTNVRPMKNYKYIYPFDGPELFDMVYFFEFDYLQAIDDEGYSQKMFEAVTNWKNRRGVDQLVSVLQGEFLQIFDTRPVAIASEHLLDGIERHLYEFCDQIRTIRQIQTWLEENFELSMDKPEIESILNGFIHKKLMIEENSKYLSLAVMTYESTDVYRKMTHFDQAFA